MNSLHALQSHYFNLREWASPVLKESKFKEHGRITPEEFVAAGDFLTYKFPVWTWQAGDATKKRDYLPDDKQYLLTRGVPCLRRATSLAYTDADEDAEKMLSFDPDSSSKEDEWVQTHAGRPPADSAANPHTIADIPDLDGVAGLSKDVEHLNVGDTSEVPADIPDMDDIPDMEEEGIEGVEDAATAPAPVAKPPVEAAKGNLLQVRTYDVMITYDKYYQTPRIWLQGFDEKGKLLTNNQIFEDVSADHAFKTVTIEPFPHTSNITAASVHPCKHASVMKKVIERMNAGVIEEQRKAASGSGGKEPKEKRKWLGLKKVSSSSSSTPSGEDTDDVEGMRVDFYLVVFLKFIASIVPTIEVDSTAAF